MSNKLSKHRVVHEQSRRGRKKKSLVPWQAASSTVACLHRAIFELWSCFHNYSSYLADKCSFYSLSVFMNMCDLSSICTRNPGDKPGRPKAQDDRCCSSLEKDGNVRRIWAACTGNSQLLYTHMWIKYYMCMFRITLARSRLMSYDKRHDEVSTKGK